MWANGAPFDSSKVNFVVTKTGEVYYEIDYYEMDEAGDFEVKVTYKIDEYGYYFYDEKLTWTLRLYYAPIFYPNKAPSYKNEIPGYILLSLGQAYHVETGLPTVDTTKAYYEV